MSSVDAYSVCVVNYNGAWCLPQTLSRVSELHGVGDIVVIDSGSTDGSVADAESEFPGIRFIRMDENCGPAAARNVGFSSTNHNRVLFLDNDVEPNADCGVRLSDALGLSPNAAVAMATVLYADRPDVAQFTGASAHFIGLLSVDGNKPVSSIEGEPNAPIGSIVSSAFMVDRSRWPDNILFNDMLFIYLEDHEFGLRARALGREIIVVRSAFAAHGRGTPGLSLRREGIHAAARVEHTIRNRWVILLELYQLRTLLLLSPALIAFEIVQAVGAFLRGWGGAWIAAVEWLIRNSGSVRAHRQRIQGMRRVPDRDLLSGGPLPLTPQVAKGPLGRSVRAVLEVWAAAWWRVAERWL